MSKSFYKKTISYFHLNSRAVFSKKYPKKRVEEIFKIDPDYLLYIFEKTDIGFAEEVTIMLEAYKKNKAGRGITKVTCFK